MTVIGWQLSSGGADAAELTDSMILPADTQADGNAKVAPQIVFLLREDLEGPGVTAAAVCSVASVAAGLALTDDATTVTGMRLAAHAVACEFDLSLLGALLEVGGEVVATAAGAAIAGHPAEAVASFVNRRANAGAPPLRRGQIVGSGLLMEPRPLTGASEASAVFARLGTVTLTLTR